MNRQRAQADEQRRQREQENRFQNNASRMTAPPRSQAPYRAPARGTGTPLAGNRAVLPNGRLTRPLTAGEIQRGFTGRVTPDGRALIKVQNRVFTVPASRIAGLSARLAKLRSSTSLSTQQKSSRVEFSRKLAASGNPSTVSSRRDAAEAWRAKNRIRFDEKKNLIQHDPAAIKAARSGVAAGGAQKLRKGTGVASYDGKLPHVSDPNWFGRRKSLPVPGQIAQKLHGRKFSGFSAFRNALWREIEADPLLRQSFDQEDLDRMKQGNAPRAAEVEQRGKRAGYELDHQHEIQDGGGTYDLNNIRIKTPMAHKQKISRDFNLGAGAH
jgi:hypothetical protein